MAVVGMVRHGHMWIDMDIHGQTWSDMDICGQTSHLVDMAVVQDERDRKHWHAPRGKLTHERTVSRWKASLLTSSSSASINAGSASSRLPCVSVMWHLILFGITHKVGDESHAVVCVWCYKERLWQCSAVQCSAVQRMSVYDTRAAAQQHV
jgi:hypothetical protein